jgi:hypothetical protein
MASRTSPIQRASIGPGSALEVGSYLTDGTRLLCLVGYEADQLALEDARTYAIEWHVATAVLATMRSVKPTV